MAKYDRDIADTIERLAERNVIRIILALHDGAATRQQLRQMLTASNGIITDTILHLQEMGFIAGGTTRGDPVYLTDHGTALAEWYQSGWLIDVGRRPLP